MTLDLLRLTGAVLIGCTDWLAAVKIVKKPNKTGSKKVKINVDDIRTAWYI